jgi:hypothetical protein
MRSRGTSFPPKDFALNIVQKEPFPQHPTYEVDTADVWKYPSRLIATALREERVLAELTIPKALRPALEKIRTLPDSTFQTLVSAWERPESDLPSVSGLPTDDADSMRDAVLELFRVRDFYTMEIPELAVDIAAGLQESAKFPGTEIPAFEDRLKKVLTIRPLAIAAKADSLKVEFERRFCTARILTDARPIYIDKPSAQPDAVMITHTARITYHDDTGEMREVYIMMDNDDLATFRELIDRAEEKTKSLQAVFAAANIQIVNP